MTKFHSSYIKVRDPITPQYHRDRLQQPLRGQSRIEYLRIGKWLGRSFPHPLWRIPEYGHLTANEGISLKSQLCLITLLLPMKPDMIEGRDRQMMAHKQNQVWLIFLNGCDFRIDFIYLIVETNERKNTNCNTKIMWNSNFRFQRIQLCSLIYVRSITTFSLR